MKTTNEAVKSQQPANLKARLESQEAFGRAIRQGRLTDNPAAANYAGKYMYMGREQKGDIGKDLFKNINTRQYDV